MTQVLKDRAEQLEAVASLGLRALSGIDLPELQDEAVLVIAKILKLEICGLLKVDPSSGCLVHVAGTDCPSKSIGLLKEDNGPRSLGGVALRSNEPVTVEDFRTDARFRTSENFRRMGIISSISVSVAGVDGAWGVLYAHSIVQRRFTQDEATFIHSIANILTESRKLAARYAAKLSSELQFSSAFENAAIGFGLTTVQGQWVRVNRSLCKLLGYTAEELLSKNLRDITYAEDLNSDEDDKQSLLADEISSIYREKRFVHKQGHVIWIQLNISITRDKSGNPLHYMSQIQNITERKAADLELRESRDLFRIVSEAMPQIVWMTTPDGRNIYFNHRWTEYTGLSSEESAGHNWIKPFHPDDQNRAQDAWATATSTNGMYSLECRLRKHDGSYQWWLIRGLPQFNGDGKVFRWVGSCTEINDLKLALEKAQTFEEKIGEQSKLIHQASDAIVLMDLDSQIKVWNEGARQLYGWTAEEAVGKRKIDLYAHDANEHLASVQLLLRDGHWEGVLKQKTRTGVKISVATRWTLSRDAKGNPKSILSISADFTERDKVQTQAFRAQRMESLGTLAGGIAHDLNNVLTPIMMSVELLKLGENSKKRLATLDTIETCSLRGAEMIRKVLSFARGIEGERSAVQPKHLLQEVEKIANDTFLKSIQIKINLPSNLWTVSGDTTQLHQVLLNLCVNARDAMPGGGILTLSAENVTLEAKSAASMDGCDPGTYVLISVEDTGMGMPKEILDRAFEPFFTTKEIGKGTGLGLSTSLAIIKSHGGFFRVYSDEGRGTRFNVYLPTIKDGAALSPVGTVHLPRGAGEWILVVDDEAAVRQITRHTLEAFGYRVSVAGGGSEAIAIYGEQKGNIALVLTDMMMPLMDGVATIRELRRINPEVLVIAASGLSTNAEIAAESHFLAKPYTTEALLKSIRKTLDS